MIYVRIDADTSALEIEAVDMRSNRYLGHWIVFLPGVIVRRVASSDSPGEVQLAIRATNTTRALEARQRRCGPPRTARRPRK